MDTDQGQERDPDFQAILHTFLVESEELLGQMEEALIDLEAHPENEETIQTIFRGAHTLKGNAACLECQGVADLAHAAESLLQRLRDHTLPVTGGLITLLLQTVDALRQMVPDAVAGITKTQPAHSALLKRLTEEIPTAIREEEAADGPGPERRRRPFGRRPEDFQTWLDRKKTLRVDIEKLDRMLNLSGEIAIAQGRLRQLLEKKADSLGEEILDAHRALEGLFMDIQEQVMKVRMVAITPMFRQHIRTVRDVARAHGKSARLVIDSGDVEADTTVIEYLKDPITHMIRNAVGHGIETPEKRKAAGKDPCGRVTLRAFHDTGCIVIQLEDDGGGFQKDRILEKARSLGMVSESQNLSDEEAYRLVFEPGFSTAETVTDLSGRGVGMDVVQRNIDALRGSVQIESRNGLGSMITIRLPLTLAIIEGLAVGAGEETYVFPLDAVIECLDLPKEERDRGDDRGVVHLRGKALPYIRLQSLTGLRLPGAAQRRASIVVVRHRSGRIGFVVDALYGEIQAVIKPLGRLFQGLSGVSGSTILGNGRVALILDVPGLLRSVQEQQPQPAGRT